MQTSVQVSESDRQQQEMQLEGIWVVSRHVPGVVEATVSAVFWYDLAKLFKVILLWLVSWVILQPVS